MAKFRTIQVGFWDDPYVERLSKDGKLLYTYLITSSHTNSLGVLEITLKKISYETDIDVETIDALLTQMETDGKIVRDKEEIWIINFIRHQCSQSPQVWKMLANEAADGVHSAKILTAMARVYPKLNIPYDDISAHTDTVSTPYEHTVDTVSKPREYPIDTLSIPYQYPIDTQVQVLVREQVLVQEQNLEACASKTATHTPAPEASDDDTPEAQQDSVDTLELSAETAKSAVPSEAPKSKPESQEYAVSPQEIADLWNATMPQQGFSRVSALSKKRIGNIRARQREFTQPKRDARTRDFWRRVFRAVARSDFLNGTRSRQRGGNWQAGFDFCIESETKLLKIIEGQYDDRPPEQRWVDCPNAEAV